MNGTMIQFFHWYSDGNGQLYDQIKNSADYLNELGISSVWFPPAYKGAGGGYSVGYDPYDLFDLGVENRLLKEPPRHHTQSF